MRSDEVFNLFPPINFEKGLKYLKGIEGLMSSVVCEFSELKNEKQMVEYKYPAFVSKVFQEYRDGRYSKDSDSYRNLNSAVTAINILKACANINLAIYALRDKYLAKETELYNKNPALSRYMSFIKNNQSSIVSNSIFTQEKTNLPYSRDADILRIKDAVIYAREKIQSYSKKYTVEGFEEDFINTVKYRVYSLCDIFGVETRTITERTVETSGNILGAIIKIGLYGLIIMLVGKCVTG